MAIKNLLKNWIVPPAVSYAISKNRNKSVVSAFSPSLFSLNKAFNNIHKGKRCFILASGPSIKTQDLSPIYGEINIAVSHFHLHEKIDELKPKYHVLAPQHPPFTFNDGAKYFDDFITQYADIKPDIFLGLTPYNYNYLELLKLHPEYNQFKYHYLDYSSSLQLDESNQFNTPAWDISLSPFAIRTVLYSAIQIAMYMGFKEIYLVGADHDYLADTTRTTNHHFYKEESGISDKSHLEAFTSERWFFEYYMRWKQYRLMKEYCESKGTVILNATEGGMLDVFQRVKLDII